MKAKPSLLLCIWLAGLAAVPALAAGSRDWPHWNGPNHDLTAAAGGVFNRPFGLETVWTRELGSGYSGIVVVGNRVITALSADDDDVLVALDAADGKELWRYRIGEIYKGHDGSDDGPLATPTVAAGRVFGLGAWGRLFALDLEDGSQLWAHKLDEGFGAVKPEYGFTTSPTVIGGVLVVQTGGSDGQSISAFDPATGKLLWATEDGMVDYQTPLAIEVGGEEQIFAVNNNAVLGLAPATGEVLWKHRHASEDMSFGFAHPLPIGDDKVLITDWPGSALYQLVRDGGKPALTEVWNNRSFRGTYATPVPYGDHLYGYSGNFLTCVDAATGETVWKSRPPGGGYLALVDGHLLIQTGDGEIVVAEATPEGYREKARTQVLERGYFNTPSFAGGRVYVRNLTQIASVGITDRPQPAAVPEAEEDEPVLLGEFGEWVREVEAATEKKKLVDEYMAAQKSFPIVEGDKLVHFVYRGEVEDLAITGNMIHNREELMSRIAGTDLYFRSYELAPASHYAYAFNIFEETITDPKNPRQDQDLAGERSIVVTPGWVEPGHLAEPAGERGKVEKYKWVSEALGDEREVQIYLPPGYGSGDDRYPLFLVNYGDQMLAAGKMNNSLDNLIGHGVEPLVGVFVPRRSFEEYAGTRSEDYTKALVEELIPYVDEHYRTRRDPGSRGITGVASGAAHSIYAAFSRPEVFGRAAVQSYYFGGMGDEVKAMIADGERRDLRLYVAVSSFDYVSGQVDAQKESTELVALLEKNGYRPVVEKVGDGVGWASWASRTDRILTTLFPAD